jgi:hypothetical protein
MGDITVPIDPLYEHPSLGREEVLALSPSGEQPHLVNAQLPRLRLQAFGWST